MTICVFACSTEKAPAHSAIYTGHYLLGCTVFHFWIHAFISFVCSSDWGKGASLHSEFPQRTARVQIICVSNQKIQNPSVAPDLSIRFVMPDRVDNSSAVLC